VVSFRSQLLFPQGKSSWYPLARRLGGPQCWSAHGGKGKEYPSLPLLGIEPQSSSL